jgi:hypothetical protein
MSSTSKCKTRSKKRTPKFKLNAFVTQSYLREDVTDTSYAFLVFRITARTYDEDSKSYKYQITSVSDDQEFYWNWEADLRSWDMSMMILPDSEPETDPEEDPKDTGDAAMPETAKRKLRFSEQPEQAKKKRKKSKINPVDYLEEEARQNIIIICEDANSDIETKHEDREYYDDTHGCTIDQDWFGYYCHKCSGSREEYEGLCEYCDEPFKNFFKNTNVMCK